MHIVGFIVQILFYNLRYTVFIVFFYIRIPTNIDMDSVTVGFQSQNASVTNVVIKTLLASYVLLNCSCMIYNNNIAIHLITTDLVSDKYFCVDSLIYMCLLTFRNRAFCILGQAFHYSPENAFYIFSQQIYFII